MYLHLGADCMIKNTDIIAIFNIRDQQSEIYDNYISVNKDKYKIIDLSENGECSSCILTTDTLYLRINIKLLIYRKMVSVQAVF